VVVVVVVVVVVLVVAMSMILVMEGQERVQTVILSLTSDTVL
jgi:hypothetical protein